MVEFVKECVDWLAEGVNAKELNHAKYFSKFKITESGDIFKGETYGNISNGKGILLTKKNELIEGYFSYGFVQRGYTKIFFSTGDYYEGFVGKNGVRNGKGVHHYANGDIYDGEFVNNKRVGKAQLKFKDNSQYLGQFINDEADGHGIYTDAVGNRYQSKVEHDHDGIEGETGSFLKGKLYGKGEIKYMNGNHYIGHLKGTLRDGYGEMTYVSTHEDDNEVNKGVYKGQWKRDMRDGHGVMHYENKSKFEGIWSKDKKSHGSLTLLDGSVYIGYFQDDMYHGEGKLKHISGLTIEGKFIKGEFCNKGKLTLLNG